MYNVRLTQLTHALLTRTQGVERYAYRVKEVEDALSVRGRASHQSTFQLNLSNLSMFCGKSSELFVTKPHRMSQVELESVRV